MSSLLILLLYLGMASWAIPVRLATAKEETHQADDLVLTVDSTWAGCGYGGYYPIRIQIMNRGKPRELTFRFSGNNSAVPTVLRRISLDQNATSRFTLSVPCVGGETYGELTVSAGGRLIKGLSQHLAIPDSQYGTLPRTSLLVISPIDVDCESFENAVTANIPQHALHGGFGYYGGVSEDHAVIKPTLLPDNWVDYSGLDLVAIPLDTLAVLDTENRTALMEWVHTGGTLLVYGVGEEPQQSKRLATLLGVEASGDAASAWTPAALEKRRGIANLDEVLAQVAAGGGHVAVATPIAGGSPAIPPEPTFDWGESPQTFAHRELMLGHVFAFPANPFPGTPHDWDWLLDSLPDDDQVWVSRHGLSARVGTDHFMNFLIPSVKGIPLTAFLLLITLFTIVIGPLNYLWLWKQRRLYLLVITIPLIALVMSLALFGYSAVAHGFGTRTRIRSLTMLDQKTNTAVAISRIALFAGLAPAEGLWFSPRTALYPIWPEDREFESGTVDWTEGQHLGSGWLHSRTRTQFLTVEHRDERGRLEIRAPSAGVLPVTNGLEWGFRALVVTTDDGDVYFGRDIPAGASAELVPITPQQEAHFAELLAEHPLQPPTQPYGKNDGFFRFQFAPVFRYGHDLSTTANYSHSRMERLLTELKSGAWLSPESLKPRTYAGVLTERPGINLGLEGAREQVSLHVLKGYF